MPNYLGDPKPVKIRCDACPVMCFIADGKSGACDRYANHAGELVRLDPLTVIQSGAKAVRHWRTALCPRGRHNAIPQACHRPGWVCSH